MRVFYDVDNTCLRAKYPTSLANGITIQAIATFGAIVRIQIGMLCLVISRLYPQIIHTARHLEATRLGKSPPDLETAVYYPLYEQILEQLQLELNANNGLKEYIEDMSAEGSLWILLVGPEEAIRPLPTPL